MPKRTLIVLNRLGWVPDLYLKKNDSHFGVLDMTLIDLDRSLLAFCQKSLKFWCTGLKINGPGYELDFLCKNLLNFRY